MELQPYITYALRPNALTYFIEIVLKGKYAINYRTTKNKLFGIIKQLPNDLQASLNLICMIANDTLIEVFARLPQDITSFTIT